jgi:hypothetical protein
MSVDDDESFEEGDYRYECPHCYAVITADIQEG